MLKQPSQYERTVAFQLWLKYDNGRTERIALQGQIQLPISQKCYKATLKNVKVYINELLELDSTIQTVHIDRIVAVGVIRRKRSI